MPGYLKERNRSKLETHMLLILSKVDTSAGIASSVNTYAILSKVNPKGIVDKLLTSPIKVIEGGGPSIGISMQGDVMAILKDSATDILL